MPELRTIDRGPRTGVTGAVCLSALDLIEGGPQDAAGGARGLQILVDGLDGDAFIAQAKVKTNICFSLHAQLAKRRGEKNVPSTNHSLQLARRPMYRL